MEKYIKKSLVLVSFFTFFLFNFGGIVLAQTMASPDIAPIPPIPSDNSNSLLFGQKHSYSVVFRANGEAITYAKLVIPNREEKALSEFSFEIPNVDVSEIIMYQMKLPKECVRYDYAIQGNPCLEYRDPDYGQDYYYYGLGQTAEYTKIKYTKTDNTYKLTLPNAVEPNKSTAIIISYATKSYVNQNFGLYKFNFETIKVPSRIQSIKVAVYVDSDLFIKGKQSSVNYNEVSNMSMAKLGDSSAVSSRELDSLVSNIGNSGSIIKESKSLAPNETFNVKGEYAKNWFRLYLNEMIIAILIIFVVIILIYLISKYINSKPKNNSNINKDSNLTNNSETINNKYISLFNLTNILVSFGSILGTIIVTYLLLLFFIGINILGNSDFITISIGLVAVIVAYGFTLLVPAIIIVLKRGWGSLLSIIILQFIWFVIILTIYLILFKSGLTEMMPMPRPMVY